MNFLFYSSVAMIGISIAWAAYHIYHNNAEPPNSIRLMVTAVNRGIIPPTLQNYIPVDYEMREEYSMSCTLERTFLPEEGRGYWGINLILDDGVSVSTQVILFDNHGNLYQ